MKTVLMAASAVAMLFAASAAEAGSGKKAHKSSAAVAGPAQPIPYAQLDAYLKASPKQRASQDWWSGQQASASTGMSSNASDSTSTTSATPSDSTSATIGSTSSSMSSDNAGGAAGAVNPPTDAGSSSGAAPNAGVGPNTTSGSPTAPSSTTPQ